MAVIEPDLLRRARQFASQRQLTLYHLTLATLAILLAKLSQQEDVVIGSMILGRPLAPLERIIGMFINILAIRTAPAGEKLVSDFLAEIKRTALEALEHQDYQFDDLVDHVKVPRDLGRSPLVDVQFSYMSFDRSAERLGAATLGDIRIKPYDGQLKYSAKADITLFCTESECLTLAFEYASRLFEKSTMTRWAHYFVKIFSQLVAQPQARLKDIDLLDEGDLAAIFNWGNRDWPERAENLRRLAPSTNQLSLESAQDTTLAALFQARVKRTPERTATVFRADSLTYHQLNQRANQLARRLRQRGVGQASVVALISPRSTELIIAILAILKAGGAYLPIDPDCPSGRLRFMLEDSRAKLILTTTKLRQQLFGTEPLRLFQANIIDIVDPGNYQGDARNLASLNTPNDLAYIIYTSGSTGQPKGVMIEQRAVLATLRFLQRHYPLGPNDAYLFKTNYVFDVAVAEIFGWFFDGGKLVILDPGFEKDPAMITAAIARHQVSHVNFVPTMLHEFFSASRSMNLAEFASLKYIFLAGEALSPELLEKIGQLPLSAKWYNLYGPTEASIYASHYPLAEWRGERPVPIGKPLDQSELYILDHFGRPVPIGVIGELCLAGAGLARGYLNQPDLSAERFVEHPWRAGQKLYKSGDRARWLVTGNVQFFGRQDDQIKIRGFRVELGEIEARIRQSGLVRDCAVIMRLTPVGPATLVAYLVGVPGFSLAALKTFLAAELPGYMLPSTFVELEQMPQTASGKLDRRHLPEPAPLRPALAPTYVAPSTPLEQQLARIYAEILALDTVGRDDNFFELGGNSIHLLQFGRILQDELHLDVAVLDLFLYPNIAALVGSIQAKQDMAPATTEMLAERNETIRAGRERLRQKRGQRRGRDADNN
jgi:amino acid adenylation domain-containing protein